MIKDLTGQRFGTLTAAEYMYSKDHVAYWKFICDCGEEKITRGRYAVVGKLVKCSYKCKLIINPTKSPLYRRWAGIKDRCTNKNSSSFKYYGAKGITLYKEWYKFKPFEQYCYENFDDLEFGIKNNYDIDRIDNTKGYEPGNVRFIPHIENCNNRDYSNMVFYQGKLRTKMEIWKAFNQSDISYDGFKYRLRKGMDIDEALTKRSLKGNGS